MSSKRKFNKQYENCAHMLNKRVKVKVFDQDGPRVIVGIVENFIDYYAHLRGLKAGAMIVDDSGRGYWTSIEQLCEAKTA